MVVEDSPSGHQASCFFCDRILQVMQKAAGGHLLLFCFWNNLNVNCTDKLSIQMCMCLF